MIRWLSELSGIGTELGIANTTLLVIVGIMGWLASREIKDLRGKIDAVKNRNISRVLAEHDEMYDDWTYRKRREESAQKHLRRNA